MCPEASKVDLYYDGELFAADQSGFEAHLSQCAECRRALDELNKMTLVLRSTALPTAPEALAERALAAWNNARNSEEAGLRRMAGWMTAAAAVVLMAAMLRVSLVSQVGSDRTMNEASASAIRDWEFAAVLPPDRPADDSAGSADLIQVAQWMAHDLSR
jgi:anti-sigma factor RsiW